MNDTTNPLLDKRLINAFVNGVIDVLSKQANTPVTTGKPFVEKEISVKGEIVGIIGMVAGKMKGTMTISFQKQAVFDVIDGMIGERYTEITNDVSDAVGELTNQIYGSAKTTLNQLGYSFEMAIPTVIHGDFSISAYHHGTTLVIPFEVPNGARFFIEITIE